MDGAKGVDHSWSEVILELAPTRLGTGITLIVASVVSLTASSVEQKKEVYILNSNLKGVIDHRNNNSITCSTFDSSYLTA